MASLSIVISVRDGDDLKDMMKIAPDGEVTVMDNRIDQIGEVACRKISKHMSEYLANNPEELKKEVTRYEAQKKQSA